VLCLASSFFSWLIDEAYLPYLAVKTLSEEVSLLIWGGSVITHWVKVKVLSTLEQGMEAQRGTRGITVLFL
jgi:hypothetical protein